MTTGKDVSVGENDPLLAAEHEEIKLTSLAVYCLRAYKVESPNEHRIWIR